MVSASYDYIFLAVVIVLGIIVLGVAALVVAALIKYLRGNSQEQRASGSGVE